jgi:hypothetical protein
MQTSTRGADTGTGKDRPGLFERCFYQPALSVVVATGLYRYVDPWFREQQALVKVTIPAQRRPED